MDEKLKDFMLVSENFMLWGITVLLIFMIIMIIGFRSEGYFNKRYVFVQESQCGKFVNGSYIDINEHDFNEMILAMNRGQPILYGVEKTFNLSKAMTALESKP